MTLPYMGSLSGRKIVITRPEGQGEAFAGLLEKSGGKVLSCPLIKVVPCYDGRHLRETLEKLSEFDWLCFTSANGVQFVLNFAKRENLLSFFQKTRIACIGPVTEKALESWGMTAQLVPELYQAEGLLASFKKEELKNKSILLLRAKGARKILREVLSSEGAIVTELPIYETIADTEGIEKLKGILQEGGVDCLTFTSSSTVFSFAKLLKDNRIKLSPGKIVLASIGPVTSKTLCEEGLWVDVEAAVSTTDGLTKALEKFLKWEKNL